MKTWTSAPVAAAAGVAAALLTGLLPVTPTGLVGAEWYGFPLVWLYRMVVAPQYNPWRMDFGNLLLDAVFWVALALVVLLLINVGRRVWTRP